MRNYLPLPAAQMPRNALIDMSGLSDGIGAIGQRNRYDETVARQTEQQTYQRGRDTKQDARVAEQDARTQVEWFGKTAAAIDRLQGPQREAAWQRAVARHPDRANLTPDYLDPMRGPAMVAAEAGQWRDPREDQRIDLDLQLTRAKIAEAGSGGSNEYGLNPLIARDANGNIVALQPSKRGGARPIDLPDGMTLDLEAKARATETGKAAGKYEGGAPMREAGRQRLSGNLEGIVGAYLKLDELGAIVNPDRKDPLSNIKARIGSSDAGQAIGGAIGTEAQSVRERINNARPLLIQGIMQATGMSARSLDSNRELDFYLQAASTPTKDIYSNLVAIEVLDKTYGLGGVVEKMVPPEMYQRIQQQAAAVAAQRPIPMEAAPEAQAGQTGQGDAEAALNEARQAIQRGKDPAAVAERLRSMGIDPRGL